jgi:hypothetical protein
MSYTCENCGHVSGPSRKLGDWEVTELRARATRIIASHPPKPWQGKRWSELQSLAADYGINVRTLYRYLERAA